MPDVIRAFEDATEYVNKAFESRFPTLGHMIITVLEVGSSEFWVESDEGRFALDIEDFDRSWKPYVRLPSVGEFWTRRDPYQGCCEILSVSEDYVVYTFDPTGSRANPVMARTLDSFMRTYEPPEK